MNEIEEMISSLLAPITGATAAIAELPQIELPQAIRIDRRAGRPSNRLMPKLAPSARMTTITIAPSRARPDAAIAPNVKRSPEQRDGHFQQLFRGEGDPHEPAAVRFPNRADDDPEQNGDDDGFDIGVSDELLFSGLDGHRDKRNEPAERYPPGQRNSLRDHPV